MSLRSNFKVPTSNVNHEDSQLRKVCMPASSMQRTPDSNTNGVTVWCGYNSQLPESLPIGFCKQTSTGRSIAIPIRLHPKEVLDPSPRRRDTSLGKAYSVLTVLDSAEWLRDFRNEEVETRVISHAGNVTKELMYVCRYLPSSNGWVVKVIIGGGGCGSPTLMHLLKAASALADRNSQHLEQSRKAAN